MLQDNFDNDQWRNYHPRVPTTSTQVYSGMQRDKSRFTHRTTHMTGYWEIYRSMVKTSSKVLTDTNGGSSVRLANGLWSALAAILTVGTLSVAQARSETRTIVALPLGVAGTPSCPTPNIAPVKVDEDILQSARAALTAELVARGPNRVSDRVTTASSEAIVVSTCIKRADAGNELGRVIGMGMGASTLQAHVVVRHEPSNMPLLETFDVTVTGKNILPPLGPAGLLVHKAKSRGETLSADASKLGRQIADRILGVR